MICVKTPAPSQHPQVLLLYFCSFSSSVAVSHLMSSTDDLMWSQSTTSLTHFFPALVLVSYFSIHWGKCCPVALCLGLILLTEDRTCVMLLYCPSSACQLIRFKFEEITSKKTEDSKYIVIFSLWVFTFFSLKWRQQWLYFYLWIETKLKMCILIALFALPVLGNTPWF